MIPQNPDVELDAAMIHASMTFEDGHMFYGMSHGMTPDEVTQRIDWFKDQPLPYKEEVIERVRRLR